MTKCPHCFADLTTDVVLYGCTGGCDPVFDPRLTELHGSALQSRPLTPVARPTDPRVARRWEPPTAVQCRVCQARADEVCRNCHYPLPRGWRNGRALCVALAGSMATGKSVYMGILVKYLEAMVEELGSTLRPVGNTQAQYKTAYEEPLLIARKMLKSTSSATVGDSHQRFPLIYSLGMLGNARQETFLVFRDVAGEDQEHNSQLPHLSFYERASMVLYLFDPTHIAEIREELRGRLSEKSIGKGDPKAVWQNVLALANRGSGSFAIAVAKFDNLHVIGARAVPSVDGAAATDHASGWEQRLANPGAAFNREPAWRAGTYDEVDGQLLHEEIRSMMSEGYAQGIINAMENPANRTIEHRFFAVSALGAQPDIEGTNPRGIAPFRILDPIRWLLAREGVLGMTTK